MLENRLQQEVVCCMLYAVLHIIPLRSQIQKEGHKSRDHGIF